MLRYPFSKKKAQRGQTNLLQESPDLEKLAQSLQPVLQAQIMASQLQVRCAIRQRTLFILIEHLLHVEPSPQQVFVELEAIVRKNTAEHVQDPSFAAIQGTNLPVRLFLRIAGHQQPYQFHTFSVSLISVDQGRSIATENDRGIQQISAFVEPSTVQSRSSDSVIEEGLAAEAAPVNASGEATTAVGEAAPEPAISSNEPIERLIAAAVEAVPEVKSEVKAVEAVPEVEIVPEVEAGSEPEVESVAIESAEIESVEVDSVKVTSAELVGLAAIELIEVGSAHVELEAEPEATEAHLVDVEAEATEPVSVELIEIDFVDVEPVPIETIEAVATEPVAIGSIEDDFVDTVPQAIEAGLVEPVSVEPVSVEPVSVEPAEVNSTEVEPDAEVTVSTIPPGAEVAEVELVADQELISIEPVAAVPSASEPQEIIAADDIESDRQSEAAGSEQTYAAIEFTHPDLDSSNIANIATDLQQDTAICEDLDEPFLDEVTEIKPDTVNASEYISENAEFAAETEFLQSEFGVELESDRSSLVEPISELISEPISGPISEPIAEPISESVSELILESPVEASVDELTETELQELESSVALSEEFSLVPEPLAPEPLVPEPIEPVVLQAAEPALPEARLVETEAFEPRLPDKADEPQDRAQTIDEENENQFAEQSLELPTESIAALSIDQANDQATNLFADEFSDEFITPSTDRPETLSDSLSEQLGRLEHQEPEIAPETIAIPETAEPYSIDSSATVAFIEDTALPQADTPSAIESEIQEDISQEDILQEDIPQDDLFQEEVIQENVSQENISRNAVDDRAENYIDENYQSQSSAQVVSPIVSSIVSPNSTSPDFAAVNDPAPNRAAAETSPETKGLSFSEVLELEAWSDRQSFLRRMSISAWIFAGTVGVFGVVTGIYALTRPCVIGGCLPVEQAQQISDRALNTIQTTESALAIVDAHNQLREVNALLSPIPFWSPHYESAQQIMKVSEARASRVAQIVNALEKANAAAQKSLNPPHPLAQWREIQWLWRDAIAALQKIPPDSPVYDLAQRRLQEYETSLNGINQRVATEQNAQERVNAARRTAEVAEAQAGIAKSAQDWQQSYAAWQAAVKVLDQIPQGTAAYAEAEQLLALYQPRLQEANQRQGQETIAENALRQANQLAEQARSLEQQNQWIEAKTIWQQAVTNLQRIPQGSVYSMQVQSTLQSYTAAMTQAEKNAARLTAMQAVQPDLDRTCAGMVPLCTYSFAPQAIRVQITRSYDQATERVMTSTQSGSMQAVITTQVNNLLRSLAAISETAKVPIELYNADGSRFGTYSPEASGFVAQ